MKLEYIGPKAMISPQGISFKTGKDDKFVYLDYAMQIFTAINHDYQNSIIYHHNIEDRTFTAQEILATLNKAIENLDNILEQQLEDYVASLNMEIKNVQEDISLNDDEKTSLKNNLIIMKPYRIQRFKNKLAYEHLVKAIASEIYEHKLQEISAPFNERFWHIMQTIQGYLSSLYKVNATVETITNEDSITIVLKMSKIF